MTAINSYTATFHPCKKRFILHSLGRMTVPSLFGHGPNRCFSGKTPVSANTPFPWHLFTSNASLLIVNAPLVTQIETIKLLMQI